MFPYDSTDVTLELRQIVESGVDIWDFDYPIPRKEIEYNGKTCAVDFDKETFQKKVLDHYWLRQIGQETVGRFLHYFRSRIREIMPYYVQVYELDAKFRNIEDPLESYNLVEEFRGTNKGQTTAKGNNIFSDTPQGDIHNLFDHMTNATKTDDTTDTTGESGHTLTRRGNIGVQPLGGEVQNIRSAFINIDLQIIEDLADLFLMIY